MTVVKICGLMSVQDIRAVNETEADFAGMILSEGFRRSVSMPEARLMKGELSPRIKMCGVFVNAPIEYIRKFIEEGVIDIVQLHGNEDEAFIGGLKQEYPDIPVIRAFTVKNAEDVRRAESSAADMIILDAGKGTGKAFDWDLLEDMHREYILAGGLTPDNVAEAVRTLQPYGADTSSGVETDGRKDREKIHAFVKNAKGGHR
ncbi:MAG: phosphoribosylanthranilate isomerase [Solobacterium sp.]|nr:phosphoribosylanthranilate isomerase [Solobacterium sp.]